VHGLTDEQRGRAGLRCSRPTVDTLLVEFSGSWRLQDEFPALTDVEQSLDDTPRVQRITFDTAGLTAWDSGLLTFLLELIACGARRQIVVDQEGLPSGLRRLLHLATAVPERQGARGRSRSFQGRRAPFACWPTTWSGIRTLCSTAKVRVGGRPCALS
jgi:ABC-type transporter Mla MlaB component